MTPIKIRDTVILTYFNTFFVVLRFSLMLLTYMFPNIFDLTFLVSMLIEVGPQVDLNMS